jgi:hypothetical protein
MTLDGPPVHDGDTRRPAEGQTFDGVLRVTVSQSVNLVPNYGQATKSVLSPILVKGLGHGELRHHHATDYSFLYQRTSPSI